MPRFAVFENVPGIIRTVHGREYYEKLSGGLKKLGYKLIEELENAADFGVGQIRKRVIVVGSRGGEYPPSPQKTHSHPSSPEVKKGLLLPWKTVKDVIGNGKYPPLNAGENGEQEGKYPNHIAPVTGKKVLEFIKMVPKDGGSRKDVPKDFWLHCHELHEGHTDVYGRLSWNKPSNTITTGCTNISKGRFVHPEQDRALTYREAAALQGFPDNFVFYGNGISSQIGNAVPPPLAYAIARALMAILLSEGCIHKLS
jgi:DNA (cytosine-5)-methyltransferase 1